MAKQAHIRPESGQGGPPGSMGMCCSCLPLQRNAQHDADREEVRVQLEAIREEVDETSVGEERAPDMRVAVETSEIFNLIGCNNKAEHALYVACR
ncbi:hypothetical protein AOLI_G00141820 [Acnodon oligacanthus]